MPEQRLLGAGLGFVEGPLWTSGGRLLITSVSRGLVYEVALDGGGPVWSIETGGGPNGLAEDAHRKVWIAQNGGRTLRSRSARPVAPGLQVIDGETLHEPVTTGFDAPNDITPGPDGRLWFTDPGARETGPGSVHVHDPATGSTMRVASGLEYPNGLAFSATGELLIAETRTARILRYRTDGDGIEPEGIFATLPEGGADGLAIAADGRVLAATPSADRVTVFAPDGAPLAPLLLGGPAFPTNLCFAGPDLETLVVTAAKGGRVLALDGVGQGLPLPDGQPSRL